MDPQVSVWLAQDAPISNATNKRKHEGEWEDLTRPTALATCSSMPDQTNLDDAANLVPAFAAAATSSGVPRKTHRRQPITAAPSLATAELLPLLDAQVAPNSSNSPSDDRCDSITSACSALAIGSRSCSDTITPAAAAAATSVCWDDLPDDVLRRVLDNLPSYSLRIVRSVCKGWWQASNRTLRFARPDHLYNNSSTSTASTSINNTCAGSTIETIPTIPGRPYCLGRSFPNLRILDLSCCDAVLEMVSPQELGFHSQLQDNALSQLSGLVYLKELVLRGCTQIKGPGLIDLAALPALEHVDFTGCTGLTDAGLASGLSGLAQVPALTFLKCTGLTDAAVALLSALPKLKRVAMPPRTTDMGLKTLVTAAPGIQRVAIRGCQNVGPDGIAALLTAPNLKRVVVSKCPKVTAAALGKVTVNVSVVSCAQAYPGPIIAASTTMQGGGSGGGNAGGGQQGQGQQHNSSGAGHNISNGVDSTVSAALPTMTNITATTVTPSTRFGYTGRNRNSDNNNTNSNSVAAVVAPGAAPDLQLMIATFHN
ncbi:putative Protein AMN1-like protein [Nannochloris sp. 'desiccata']|nr:putative Protein AMN1-like protein [Chlorella desiccata (nom. nud.)]